MGYLIWVLFEISCSLQHWKNFANRSRIDKVIARVRVAPFFGSRCTYVDASYWYWLSSVVCRSVCLSVTLVRPALIKMPFGLRTRVGPRNHVLDKGPDPPIGMGNFEGGKGRPIVKHRDTLRSPVWKHLNRSRCRLGCGLGWAQGIVLDGGPVVLGDVAMATNFGTQFTITGFVGYNFCHMIRDTQFDSRDGFSGSSNQMKTLLRLSV